jgi:hypothetical protein
MGRAVAASRERQVTRRRSELPTVKRVPIRAFLLHIAFWGIRKRPWEKPFDLDVATELVEALAEEQFTHLVIDCADGVRYRSHPELTRRHTAPMEHLEALAARARKLGLDVIPKLNFAQSRWHRHNDWMRAPGELWHEHFDDEEYFEKAFDLIDELIQACEPKRYFHIGMDEDHDRAYSQYVDAIKALRTGLRKRKLRTIIWNDTGSSPGWRIAAHHLEKSLAGEKALPKDVVHVLWQYRSVPTADVERIAGLGFQLWGAPGARDLSQIAAFRDAVIDAGGRGLLMSTWLRTRPGTRKELLDRIRAVGLVYRGEG